MVVENKSISNYSGHPVFVGDPLASDMMMELFKEALESLE